jgi:hypothetical protein
LNARISLCLLKLHFRFKNTFTMAGWRLLGYSSLFLQAVWAADAVTPKLAVFRLRASTSVTIICSVSYIASNIIPWSPNTDGSLKKKWSNS